VPNVHQQRIKETKKNEAKKDNKLLLSLNWTRKEKRIPTGRRDERRYEN
jgi:hypothetical protein